MAKSKLVDKLFFPKKKNSAVTSKAFFDRVKSGEFVDKFVFGISERTGDLVAVDFLLTPGAAFIGGTGSGKTTDLRFTCFAYLAANSENTLMLVFDAFKNATDYAPLFKYNNVISNPEQIDRFMSSIDMVWDEANKRKAEFFKVSAKDYKDYENITKTKLARIVLVVEEFHGYNDAKSLSLNEKYDTEGTTAYQFTKLMRIGRSLGIFLILATQRAGYSDIPVNIKPAITNWLIHRVSNPGDAQAAGLEGQIDIPAGANGRCIHPDLGYMQFPYVDKTINKYLDKNWKPLTGKLLAHQLEAYAAASKADGNEGMVMVKPYSFLIENHHQFKLQDIAKKILLKFGFEFAMQNKKALVAELIATKNGIKYAVCLCSNDEEKNESSLSESWKILGCDRLISINFDGRDDLSSLVEKYGGYSVGSDELSRLGKVVDDQDKLTVDEYNGLLSKLALHEENEKIPEGADEPEDIKLEPISFGADSDPEEVRKNFNNRVRKITNFD